MSQNPYSDPNSPYGAKPGQSTDAFGRPKQGGGALKWVLITVGGLGLLTLLCCGGCGLVTYLGVNAATGMIANGIKNEFADDPTVQEQLGGIDAATMNWTASSQAQAETGRQNLFVVDATGPKGSGQIRAQMAGQAQGESLPPIIWAELIKDGNTYSLRGDDDATAPAEFDGVDVTEDMDAPVTEGPPSDAVETP